MNNLFMEFFIWYFLNVDNLGNLKPLKAKQPDFLFVTQS